MKRVRIVNLGVHYDKVAQLIGPHDGLSYDEEVRIVGPFEPYDWAIQAVTVDTSRYDVRVKVVNPDALPPHLRRLLGYS